MNPSFRFVGYWVLKGQVEIVPKDLLPVSVIRNLHDDFGSLPLFSPTGPDSR